MAAAGDAECAAVDGATPCVEHLGAVLVVGVLGLQYRDSSTGQQCKPVLLEVGDLRIALMNDGGEG